MDAILPCVAELKLELDKRGGSTDNVVVQVNGRRRLIRDIKRINGEVVLIVKDSNYDPECHDQAIQKVRMKAKIPDRVSNEDIFTVITLYCLGGKDLSRHDILLLRQEFGY